MAIDIPSYILGKEKGESGTEFIVEDGEATIVENGIQTFYPSDDVDGFGSFTVKTEVPAEEPGIIVDEETFSSNGTYVAPEGHAYSPVTVQIEHPADLIADIHNTIKNGIPYFKGKYLEYMGDTVIKEFDDLITSQFVRVLFYLTGE